MWTWWPWTEATVSEDLESGVAEPRGTHLAPRAPHLCAVILGLKERPPALWWGFEVVQLDAAAPLGGAQGREEGGPVPTGSLGINNNATSCPSLFQSLCLLFQEMEHLQLCLMLF